jgi:hypothetical protein
MRVIRTKYRVYELARDEQGIPVEEYFPDMILPEPLTGSGAKVYHTADGPVVAIPRNALRKPRRSTKPQP